MRLRRCALIAASAGAALPAWAAPIAAPHTYVVVIEQMKFGPLPAGLRRGDTVMWVNRDFLRHSASAADHSFDVDLQPGAKGTLLLKKSGSIAFVCRYHPGMRGVLRVQ